MGAFLFALAGVVYMGLSGNEITVPQITGKDFVASEAELEGLGLRIKRRADRASAEPINTILEQVPKAGETVKTGQLIFVVVSKAGEAGEAAPKSLIKDLNTDDSEKIEEMISDKPKKAKSTASAPKKKADTKRDVENTDAGAADTSGDNADARSADAPAKDAVKDKAPAEKPKDNAPEKPKEKTPAAQPAKPAAKPAPKDPARSH